MSSTPSTSLPTTTTTIPHPSSSTPTITSVSEEDESNTVSRIVGHKKELLSENMVYSVQLANNSFQSMNGEQIGKLANGESALESYQRIIDKKQGKVKARNSKKRKSYKNCNVSINKKQASPAAADKIKSSKHVKSEFSLILKEFEEEFEYGFKKLKQTQNIVSRGNSIINRRSWFNNIPPDHASTSINTTDTALSSEFAEFPPPYIPVQYSALILNDELQWEWVDTRILDYYEMGR